MLRLEDFNGIYLYRDFVDMRKSINGLSQIVIDEMKLDIFKTYLFVFTNRCRNRLKVLYWDHSGFVIWYKRLEKYRFKWADETHDSVINLNKTELRQILKGYNVFQNPHKKLNYSQIG